MLRKLIFFVFALFVHNIFAQIVINEFSASNFDSHLDNYGEYEDWVELYSTTNSDGDLNGWYYQIKLIMPLSGSFPVRL